MAILIDDDLKEKLEKIKTREWWPVALLAKILGKQKKHIYRKIEEEKFDILIGGPFLKVKSESVLKYYYGKTDL